MAFVLGSTLRLVRPYPNILAFYDGRIPGLRAHSPDPNWLDDGAFALGCCAYAIVEGAEALVYDTHMSIPHARLMRQALEDSGVTTIRVVLSHWHCDHIAGNAVFSDCEIIANDLTLREMRANEQRLQGGAPGIDPVVMPTTIFQGHLRVEVGSIPVDLLQFDIHSCDETVALLPGGVLLAGDTLEDTVTYVSEPLRLVAHLKDLARLSGLPIRRILPSHGAFERIADGGYDPSFIRATELYVARLLEVRDNPQLATLGLRDFAADALATGGVEYFEPYEEVHARNIETLRAAWQGEAIGEP